MPFTGETLHIRTQIEENDRYIRAIIKDDVGATITTIPLPVFGDGLYGEDAYLMPPLEIITATIEVYLDSLFTERDEKYASDLIEFRLESDPSNDIKNLFGGVITGVISGFDGMSGLINNNPLIGVVQSEQTIIGEIEEE
jgi:hypothetical protein